MHFDFCRYDNLVIELDKMVEEGHYIPQQSSLNTAKSSKPKETVATTTANNTTNNTRRKNKTIRTQDVQKATGRFSNPKSKGSKLAGDDSTIGSDVSSSAVLLNSGNADFNGMAASASSAAVGTPANRPTTTGTVSSQPLETPIDGENKNSPDDGDDDEEDDDARSGDSDGGVDGEDEAQDDRGARPSRRTGRFSIRKMQEDTILHDKLQAHAATRMKEALLQQISDLEGALQSEKTGRKDDQVAFQQTKESMNMTQKLLATEIARLNSKVSGSVDVDNSYRL